MVLFLKSKNKEYIKIIELLDLYIIFFQCDIRVAPGLMVGHNKEYILKWD